MDNLFLHDSSPTQQAFNVPAFFADLKLSEKALAERHTTIGGSDINVIADGKPEAITKLYEQKLNKTSDDLSMVWAVLMGNITESLNTEWTQVKQNILIEDRQRVIKGIKHPFMRCTLDGCVYDYKNSVAVFDAKFTMGRPLKGEEYSEVIPRLIKKYTPQLHWNAYLLSEAINEPVEFGLLSFIKSGNEPTFHEIPIEKDYQEHLIKMGSYFIGCVEMCVPPHEMPIATPPTPLNERVKVDMTQSEVAAEWKQFSQQYLQTLGAVESFKKAETNLKNLVPSDASEASGNGLIIKVSKNNRKKIEVINAED